MVPNGVVAAGVPWGSQESMVKYVVEVSGSILKRVMMMAGVSEERRGGSTERMMTKKSA